MVNGLAHFLAHFAGFESRFILIGGTACDLWMGETGLDFRSTKDLDIVLVAESLPAEFFGRLWAFIREGRYASLEQQRNTTDVLSVRETQRYSPSRDDRTVLSQFPAGP